MRKTENQIYRVQPDGFYGELFLPAEDRYPGKALICFSGSDGGIELARTLAGIFQAQGLTKMDNMWPSEPAAEQIIKRLREHDFPYSYQHLSYEYGSHLFVPVDLPSAKFFKGDRGKNKEGGRKARMDSLAKTLEFVSRW